MREKIYSFSSILLLFLVLMGCNKDEPVIEKPIVEELVDEEPVDEEPFNEEPVDEESSTNTVLEFNGMLTGRQEADRLGLRFASADFHTTGFYAPPNTTLLLDVKKEANANVQLLIGTYSQGSNWNSQPTEIPLVVGLNEINSGDVGGMVYLRYFDVPEKTVKIDFSSGLLPAPVFKKNETTATEWSTMLSKLKASRFATLIGDKSIVVVSNEKASEFKDQDQNRLLSNIDRAITAENEISGMDGSSAIHKPISHKTLFVEYANTDFYMFAYNYRTAYNFQNGIQFVLDNEKFSKDGWGPWHEVGHSRQMDAWTWNETIEVTVNIYSLAAEKEFGIESRLKKSDAWSAIKTYLALSDSDKDYNAKGRNLFVRLGMFYQLQLAFGFEFYKELHKKFREDSPSFSNDNDRMRLFMVYASTVANADLTEFFKKWGLKFNDAQRAYDEISALNLDLPTSDPTLLTD